MEKTGLQHIALFGGAFGPPHLGHQNVVKEILGQALVDEIWYMPVKHHPFGKDVQDAQHRVAMVELIAQEHPHVRVNRYEIDKTGPSYSFDTLEFFAQTFPDHQFSWIIGSDNLPKLHQWHAFPQLIKKYHFFVYPRQGFAFQPTYPNLTLLKGMPEVTISSTQVREKIALGQSITGLVDPQVEQYIRDHHLYETP